MLIRRDLFPPRRKLRPVKSVQGLFNSAIYYRKKGLESLALKRLKTLFEPKFANVVSDDNRELAHDFRILAYLEILDILEDREYLGYNNIGLKLISKLGSMAGDNLGVLLACGENSIIIGNYEGAISYFEKVKDRAENDDLLRDFLSTATQKLGYSYIALGIELYQQNLRRKIGLLTDLSTVETKTKNDLLDEIDSDNSPLEFTSRGIGYLERYLSLYGTYQDSVLSFFYFQ
jgi:tetratricopeptide (TPR) repeat protein